MNTFQKIAAFLLSLGLFSGIVYAKEYFGPQDFSGATITVPAPSADTHASTKKYVDDTIGATYSAGGTLLQLIGSVFSLKEGTLTDTKLCTYSTASGIVCNSDDADTTYTAGTGIDLVGTVFSSDDSAIIHDNLSGFVANEHLDWTTDLGAVDIHAGNYTDTNTTYVSSDFIHDGLTGFVANEHLDWTTDQGATNIHAGNYTDTDTWRGIDDTPVNAEVAESITSNWAYDHANASNPHSITPAGIGAEPTLSKGNLTETTSNILTITGGTGAVIGSGTTVAVQAATTTTSGYLTSTDWNTFNSKLDSETDPVFSAWDKSTGISITESQISDFGTYLTGNQNITLSGDISGSGATAITTTIGADKILESMLKSVNAPTDEYFLTYEATTGDFEWQTAGGGGTVTSVGMSAPTGFSVGGSPVTGAGTLALSFAAGYEGLQTTDKSNWDTAYTDRMKWDGGATGLTAATGRTSLGLVIGTDVQAADTGLTNLSGLSYVSPSFIKFTATDTFAVRTLAETKTDLSLNNVSNVATDDTAYNATSWNTNTDAATKNSIRDKVETMDTAIGSNTSKTTESTTVSSPLVLTTYDVSIPAATNSAAGHATSSHITAIEANTAKDTNVSTSLSVGTVGANTVAITSDGGADDVTLPAATVSTAGWLTTAKWAEIAANNAKNTNVSTALSAGTITATTYGITSDGGADDIVLPEATTSLAGLLGADKWDEIVANSLKTTNATHTGDVTGATALTIGADKILESHLKAVDAAADEECLTYEATTGDFEWQTCGSGYTNLTSFVDQTAWRVFYSNTAGDVTELALGADGTYLKSNGAAAAPTFATPAGSSLFTDDGTFTYLTSTTDDFVIGSNATATADLWVDVSANLLTVGGRIDQIGLGNSTFFGFEAGLNDDLTTNNNTFIGYQAGKANTSGSYNSATGQGALSSNTTGSSNSATGRSALSSNTTGSYNTAYGSISLYDNSTGDRNIGLGYYAGRYETGSNAFYVNNQDRTNTAGDKTLSLLYGVMAAAAADQKLTINAEVGIGTISPDVNLDVEGATGISIGEDVAGGASNEEGILKLWSDGDNAFYTQIKTGTQTQNVVLTLPLDDGDADQVLQTNGAGVLDWVAAAGGGDITDVFDCSTGDCNTLTVGTSEYLTYGTGYIDANRFAGVTTVDGTEFGYLNGVTSAIQTQIAGKEGTLSNSAGLAAAIDDETGTGVAVFSISPTFTTPALGTPSALVGTNISGTGASFTAGAVTGFTPASGSLTLAGADAVTITTTAATGITLPTSGTLLANTLEDTSPELGGELDAGANSIGFTLQTITYNATTTTADWTNGNKGKMTFGAGNIGTFAFTNPTNPCSVQVIVKQDATGSRVATAWDADIKWAGGTAPTLSTAANAVDIISCLWDGTNYFCTASLTFS